MTTYYCKACNKHWSYPVKKCIFCKGDIQQIDGVNHAVIGSTQVNVPSKGNEKVPYFEYLMQDSLGNKSIFKSYENLNIGDKSDLNNIKTKDTIVGVIGTGTLGFGIAEYLIRKRYPVIIKTRSKDNFGPITAKMNKKLSKDYTKEQIDSLLKNLTIVTENGDLSSCDIIIEAATEDIGIKKDIFAELSKVCDKKAIFASNTSSLSIDEIAAATDRSDKCIGMHFFNPVSKMDLIEVIIGNKTSEHTKEVIAQFSKNINKKPIVVKNSPGFIVNRLLLPQVNDAIRLYENGIASKEDIDAAMKMGLNHPMGPFALADLIGLDICMLILNTLYESLKEERFKPANTLVDLVNSNKLGIKSGEGFYKYK
jgi:3-hydroxybutyryl-CoA dehydrogenase